MTAYHLSYWEQQSFFKDFQVAVLGSGIVGLNAALELQAMDPSLRIMVIERGPLPAGASTRNAGFACFGSVTELLDDLTRMDETAVWDLVARRYQGLRRLREKIGDQALCYEPLGGYELFRADEKAIFEACLNAIPGFNRRMQGITGLPDTYRLATDRLGNFGFQHTTSLILNQSEGQIHTGQMMLHLLDKAQAAGIRVVNGLEIKQLEQTNAGVTLTTGDGWELSFEKLLVCTNGFAQRLLPELEVTPARNQVLITQPVEHLPFEGSFHYDRGYFYFRNIDGRILLGGGRNLDPQTEQTDQFGDNTMIREALLRMLQEVILPGQKTEVAAWWSGILGLGDKKSPIIRKLGPHLAVAVRMGGMGVAIGTLVGEEAAQLLLE